MRSGIGMLMARLALLAASGLIALIAFGSLIGHPAPFILMAFSIASLPFWHELSARSALATGAAIAAFVAALPLAILIAYGEEEGGVTGLRDVLDAALWLYVAAAIASTSGMLLGRIVWAPRGDTNTTANL